MHDVQESLLDRQIAALALPCTKVRIHRERMVPLPEASGQMFGYWLNDKGKEDFVFAKEPGGKAPTANAA
jgi:hypothetical protein